MGFIGAQRSDDDQHLEIFTPKLEGNLEALISRDIFYDNTAVLSLLKQMLQALDYLATQNIIHRDVKPENILFRRHSYGLHYQLIDFGLANAAPLARTHGIGSPLFMAPEIWSAEYSQSFKVDIWSLFVTLLWASDMPRGTRRRMKGIKSRSLIDSLREIQAIVSVAAQDRHYCAIRDMAAIEPSERPSAGELLSRHFHGEGRTSMTGLDTYSGNRQLRPLREGKMHVLSKQDLKDSKGNSSLLHRVSVLEARSGIARRRTAVRRKPEKGRNRIPNLVR